MKPMTRAAALMGLMIIAGGCDQSPTIRTYTEIHREPAAAPARDPHAGMSVAVDPAMRTQDPAVQAMLDRSVAEVSLRWSVPAGWTEQAGSGMRLATFTASGSDPVSCTIISLGGLSGGLEANAVRWARQLQLAVDPDALRRFIESSQSVTGAGGLTVQVLDFSRLQEGQAPDAPGMMAGILTLADKTVFIKMTGSLKAVTTHQENFNNLLKSLTLP